MALHYVMFLLAACFTQAMAQASTPVCGVGSGDTPANAVGYGYWMQNLTSGGTVVCTYEENIGWMQSIGSDREQNIASGCQYFAIALCIVNMMFYVYHYFKATTGWEEVYVVIIELCKVCLELTHEYDNPASMYLSGGNTLLWIRYGEWLLSCPVILIHLSNLTGLKDEYNSRTMMLLVSDLGCVVMGITSAACTGYAKWIFFTIGMLYGLNTYFHAAQVYVESYKIVPRGKCQTMVKTMAWCYFTSWTLFPILFCIGPEGAGVITRSGSAIAHTVSDIMSKQVWSLLGHFLRVMVHDHMKLHGQMRMSVTGAAEVDANAVLEMTKPNEKKAKSEPSSSSSPGSSNRIAAWREEEA